VLAQIRNAFQVDISLRIFFENPTVEGLSLAVLQAQAEQISLDKLAELLAEIE
jgi:hypothetical protein